MTIEGFEKFRLSVLKARGFIKWMTIRFYGSDKSFNDENLLEKLYDRLEEILLILEQLDVCNTFDEKEKAFPKVNYYGWLNLKRLLIKRATVLMKEIEKNNTENLDNELKSVKETAFLLDVTLFKYTNIKDGRKHTATQLKSSFESIKKKILAMQGIKLRDSNDDSEAVILSRMFERVDKQMKRIDEEIINQGNIDEKIQEVCEGIDDLVLSDTGDELPANECLP